VLKVANIIVLCTLVVGGIVLTWVRRTSPQEQAAAREACERLVVLYNQRDFESIAASLAPNKTTASQPPIDPGRAVFAHVLGQSYELSGPCHREILRPTISRRGDPARVRMTSGLDCEKRDLSPTIEWSVQNGQLELIDYQFSGTSLTTNWEIWQRREQFSQPKKEQTEQSPR
jgi:hypothetical protein